MGQCLAIVIRAQIMPELAIFKTTFSYKMKFTDMQIVAVSSTRLRRTCMLNANLNIAYCGPLMCIVVGTVKGGPVSCRGVRLSPSSLGTGKMQEIKGKQLDLFR